MSTQTLPASLPAMPANSEKETPNSAGPLPTPEVWKPLFRELTTYYRHLPELLKEGDEGRYVVVKGDKICSAWDTYRDASQYGHELFGDELFMIHTVDARELNWLAPYFLPVEAACPG